MVVDISAATAGMPTMSMYLGNILLMASVAFSPMRPAHATAGAVFGQQPVIRSQDQFGNNSTVGLPASLSVGVNLTSGTGPLQGTTSLDIGSGATAVTLVLLQSAGVIDWGFLGPTA